MKRSRSALAAAILLPALCSAMTFDDLSRAAYEHSLQKSESQGKQQALRHEKGAYAAAEPITLEGSTRRIRADEQSGDGTEYGVMVGFSAKNPWVKEAKSAEFDAAIKTAAGSETLHKGLLQSSLKHEYLLGELAREEAELYGQKYESAKKAYAMSLKKHQAGRISQMELARFETEQRTARKEAEEARIAYQKHQGILKEMTLLQGEIRVDDMPFRFLSSPDTERMLKNSPVLENFALAQEELNRQIETLRRSYVETVGIGVGMTQEPTQHSVDLRVSIPLSFGDKNERRIAALMSTRSALGEQKALSEQKLRVALEQSFRQLEGMRQLIDESQSNQKQYEALYQMAHKGFEGGITGLFEYLETKNRFYAAQIETLRLKRDYVDEMAKTEEKLGRIWE
ncbi:MAG: hypothetical protein JU82_02050 [Sulfuricurvum sp. MLSB]|uniref:TolC family protein n=1 Tax=unclassified Sulfuricurvum TaxID=2632390 RepID=UPI0005059A50|nr:MULTISPECIES: TolC family protein [unclassified Sulfuricurvum]KFN40674.1 MAG: hypothetical protein JU82_02050 [Sulfuricurvum sp. MLSB]